ncbi:MAG: hypothetical protein IT276_03355 [Ignavibacteriaceae bacterium]|nr:hypothetical protein [Ignavibacterium sp.]MCC6253924.1 hypothetical protein [Ignavibacteriaceae bacterium]HMN25690.1 hypothetical protein [Ignavibacteriaceae bacterium]HRN27780.1 hypothetical protein [Ignavibacteriaceae bacterium]HRP94298.1 hypothetical protein [Ignavibacteriaceae bacterium]
MQEKSKYFSYQNLPLNENVIIEHTLKYSDVDEIKSLIEKFGIDKCKTVWEKTMIPDKRMRKLNFFLAKFIFNISLDDDEINKYFNIHNITRADRINEIFNR